MHFFDTLSPSGRHGITFVGDALSFLSQHPWPGNVRELRNLYEQLTIVHTGRTVDPALLTHLLEYRESTQRLSIGPRTTEDIERALAQAGGKISRAAEILGIHRAILWLSSVLWRNGMNLAKIYLLQKAEEDRERLRKP